MGWSWSEAGSHGAPTVAYRDAGGVTESVLDGTTGLLANDLDDLVARVGLLLRDDELRLGPARRRAGTPKASGGRSSA